MCKSFDFVKLDLIYPSEDLIKTVSEFGYAFPNLFQTFASKPSINHAIAANLHNIEHSWFSCSSNEELGWTQLIQFYTKMMIYNKVKFMSQQLVATKRYCNKLKKLN